MSSSVEQMFNQAFSTAKSYGKHRSLTMVRCVEGGNKVEGEGGQEAGSNGDGKSMGGGKKRAGNGIPKGEIWNINVKVPYPINALHRVR